MSKHQINNFVSVIIPVYNDSLRLKLCLTSLVQQSYPESQYEIIVVDNDSDDNIQSIIQEFPQVKLGYESRRSSYAARNYGIKLAQGNIIAFTDSDCIPRYDWIEQGVTTLNSTPNCGLLAGKIDIFFRNSQQPSLVELYEKFSAFPQHKYVTQRQFGVTANLFTYKKIIEEVGYFNDNLKSGGDREWGKRVYHSGYQIVYSQATCIQHPARYSWQELEQKIQRQTLGLLDIDSLELGHNNWLGINLLNWVAYILPSPRITLLILRDKSIKSLKIKGRLLVLMLRIKLARCLITSKLIIQNFNVSKSLKIT